MATLRRYVRTSCLGASFHKVAQSTSLSSLKSVQPSFAPRLSRSQGTSAVAQKAPSKGLAKAVDENKIPFDTLKGTVRYDTLKAITVKPFKMTHMTPVQASVLPLLPGLVQPQNPNPAADAPPPPARDLLVKARTGTGKTLAFLVPAIEARLDAIERAGRQAVTEAGLVTDKHLAHRAKRIFARTEVGTLIISPTRELATQIANEALRLAHHHDDFEVRLFTGGTSKRIQMRDWMKGRRDIVVSTPGRLLDLLNSEPEVKRGISKTQMLILDEADTLLDMGFREDIEAIKEFLPPSPERQTFLFSATVSREIQQIARSTLAKNHLFINTVSDSDSPVHAHVPQFHTVLPSAAEQVTHTLRLIAHDQLTNPGKSKIILFLATTKLTQLYSTLLRELSKTALPSLRDTRVYEIHSKRTQDSRITTSDAFRSDKSGASILVSSDVSARGVDYPGVTRVIQLGIPAGTEQYIHRVGRTGRAGTGGRGDLVLLPWEVGFLTWQLDGVPLKPVTTNELKLQVKTLAETYDADPQAAFRDVPNVAPTGVSSRLDRNKPKIYANGQAKLLENIPAAVDSILPSLDEEAVKETFASMLGYYMSKSPELRVQKGVIVQGCKDWTTEACGLPVPPYVSESFLQRLGFSDGRTKRFGRSYEVDRRGNAPRSSSPWSGRAHMERKEPSWMDEPPRRSGGFGSSDSSEQGWRDGGRRESRDGGYGGERQSRDRGHGGGGGFTGRGQRNQGGGGYGLRERG
ncbi:DEAD-domain-containing protein [Ramaria rubella]|nr:DEAD-domain-containing protein [Ramaria rubella]